MAVLCKVANASEFKVSWLILLPATVPVARILIGTCQSLPSRGQVCMGLISEIEEVSVMALASRFSHYSL